MTRKLVMLIVMAFALGFVGCRSCLAPYDTCQPTMQPERGDCCMGELYRCGSVLGGAERKSNANGYCESCGGGEVEYYAMDGSQGMSAGQDVEIVEDATMMNANVAEPLEFANVPVAQSAHPVERVGSYASSTQLAPYAESNFSLNDDTGEAY